MVLPSCTRCGKRDRQRMHGLMTLWFGPLAELEADLGYFYLCPACHDELIAPELERIQNRILELHPAAQRHFDEMADAALDEGPPEEAALDEAPLGEAPLGEAAVDDASEADATGDGDAPGADASGGAGAAGATPEDDEPPP